MKRPSLLPLAARMSVLNEVGTVLVNGIVRQVHANLILGKETQDWGSG